MKDCDGMSDVQKDAQVAMQRMSVFQDFSPSIEREPFPFNDNVSGLGGYMLIH